MKSHIEILFCVDNYTNGMCSSNRMNCFSAIYFTSNPKGCKLPKINSSLPVRQAGFRTEEKD